MHKKLNKTNMRVDHLLTLVQEACLLVDDDVVVIPRTLAVDAEG